LTEHEEEEGITLEEEIKILQEEGLPKDKIVEKIFEEDLNASVDTLSKLLDMGKLDIGRIKGRISRLKKRAAEKEKPKEEAPPEAAESIYKGELDVNNILNDILGRHPDINPKVREEVMDWAKMKGGLQPTELIYILQSMRGITSTTANIIASKYSFALNKAIQEGKLQLPPVFSVGGAIQTGVQPQLFVQSFPQQQPLGQPQTSMPLVPGQHAPAPINQPIYGYGSPAQITLADIQRLIKEELRLVEKPKESTPEQFVDIYEPTKNEEGQVIVNDEGQPIMKHIRVPVSQAGQFAPKEDAEERVLAKLEHYKKIFGSELTEGKIREIVRQEVPQPTAQPVEKPITIEDVQKASSDAAVSAVQKVQDEHDREKKEDERFRRLEETIKSTASAKTVEGYKEDSFRVVGQGMSELSGAIRDRRPVEVIVRDGGRLLFGGSPEKQVEPGAGEGLIKRLADRGWVTEQ